MKKFIALYYIPELEQFYERHVFAMNIQQAYAMYQSEYAMLLEITEA